MSIQENHLHKNVFSNKKKRKNMFGEHIKISIRPKLHSVDIPEFYFNNYFKTKDEFYKNISKTLKRLITNPESISDFEYKDLYFNGKCFEKFKRIHQDTYGYVVESEISNKCLHRFSHIGNRALQIYLFGTSKSSEIIFVDLYHLLIPAADKEHGEEEKDPVLHYNEVKNNKVDLNDIVLEIIKF